MNKSKDIILQTVHQNIPVARLPYPQIPVYPKTTTDILEEFKINLVIGAGSWIEIDNPEKIESYIRQIHPEAKIICSATPEVKGNRDLSKVKDPQELNDVDVGVIRAVFGVSENGMVWIREKDMQITSLGFLPQHLVILLDPTQLVKDLYEAYTRIELENDNYGCFMLGPSATADIGAVMIHGAQGARTLSICFC